MKYVALLLVVSAVSGAMNAQIPNAGFEQWVGGIPANWVSISAPAPGSIVQSTTARSGSFAVRGNVVVFNGIGFTPYLIAGPDAEGFPVTQAHASLTGYYQFTSVSNDILIISVGMQRAGQIIGAGGFIARPTTTTYTQFFAPIVYPAGGVPDTCFLQIFLADSTSGLLNAGSFFLLDDLAFSGVNTVEPVAEAPEEFSLQQNYPNPFNPSTTITFSVPQASSPSVLRVTDIVGREVATLVNEQLPRGKHTVQFDAGALAGGVYFYTLKTGSHRATRRLLILK